MVAKTRRQAKSSKPPELKPEAGWQQLDQVARRQLGMSAEAFLRAWQAGEITVPGAADRAPVTSPPPKAVSAAPDAVANAAERSPRRRRRLPEVRELTRDEGQQLFDDLARQYMGMSGEEFLRAWDAGEIKNPDRPEVMRVIFAIPFAR